jgi:hypothetical protein
MRFRALWVDWIKLYSPTWPLVASPAPMPIVGIFSAAVTAAATARGTHSSTAL